MAGISRWMAVPTLVLLLLLLAGHSWTRPYYAPMAEMVRRSEIIAVVDVQRVHAVDRAGRTFRYAQAADAVVRSTYKGRLAGRITLHAQENFVCERVDFRPGRYLVFLRRDGDLLVGSNWHLSARPIRDGRVEWYRDPTDSGDDPSAIPLRRVPLHRVLAQVRRHLPAAASR